MTIVFVVTSGSYSDYKIESVFSTEERAEKFIAIMTQPSEYIVEEFMLDKFQDAIDGMFKFVENSGLRKNKTYKSIFKDVKWIRSFECTLNTKNNTFNLHFHYLLAGQDEAKVKLFGELLIEYWIKYFGEDEETKKQQRVGTHYYPAQAVDWLKEDNNGRLGAVSKTAWVKACEAWPGIADDAVEVFD